MEDVQFENIRFNGEGQHLFIEIKPVPTPWAKRQAPGLVRNVIFKDIVLAGVGGEALGLIGVAGGDTNHTAEGVTFENVVRFGDHVTKDSPSVLIGGHTKDIVFT